MDTSALNPSQSESVESDSALRAGRILGFKCLEADPARQFDNPLLRGVDF